MKIAAKRMSADLEKARGVMEQLQEAAAPIDLEALFNCEEAVYGQLFQVPTAQHIQVPTAQHIAAFRLSGEAAAGLEQGLTNLFRKVEELSERRVWVETSEQHGSTITSLRLPQEVPFNPTVIRKNDVVLISSSRELAVLSLSMLVDGTGPSKFDDPRLRNALARLPEPEDSVVFYDGKMQIEQMRQLGPFIRQTAGSSDAEPAISMLNEILDQVAIMDFEVTSAYTDGHQNRTAAYGRLLPNVDDKVLTKVLASGQPFDNWSSWVPANASSYSMYTGANLHPIYEWIMRVLPERFPETKQGLEQWEKQQNEWNLHVDQDILQSFSGEFVSVAVPAAAPPATGGQGSVMAVRCHQPDRVRELIHRLIDAIDEQPAVKAQQLQLKPAEGLEGFDEISAILLGAVGARPVVGFRDGWMFIGSHRDAVQQILDTRAGNGQTMAQSDAFTRFNLDVQGPVYSIAFTDTATQTRNIAQFMNQAGLMAPAFIGMVAAQANAEQMQMIQELLGLLPSLGKIVAKCDFLEATLAVSQPGDEPGSYRKQTVVLVRPPAGN